MRRGELHRHNLAVLLFCLILFAFTVAGCGSRSQETGQNTGLTAADQTEERTADTQQTAEQQAGNAAEDTDAAQAAETDAGSTAGFQGRLQVTGSHLCNAAGQTVQLRGVSTHGLAWFPQYVNEDCFQQMKEEWGVNCVRLAMYTAESGGYCTGGDQENLKALVRKGVACATDQDLYVIIDWHILSDGNPNQYLAQAEDFFAEMSAEYAGNPHVIYEICNEPNGGTSWAEIRSYAETILGVIRANDPEGIVLVGTPNWSQYVDQAAADPITDYDNVMYTLHFYAATHKEELRSKLTAAVQAGLPVFVSEYGICDASGSGAIDTDQAEQWISLLDQEQISYVAWNLSNKAETSSLLAAACSRTGGFTDEDLSASGHWLVQMLQNKSGIIAAAQTADQKTAAGAADNQTTGSTAAVSKTAADDASAGTDGTVSWSVTQQNQWEAEGTTCYQYQLTVTNQTDSTVTDWSLKLPFAGEITLVNGWNAGYEVNGSELQVTPVSWNATLAAGASDTEIGFIVSGARIRQSGN